MLAKNALTTRAIRYPALSLTTIASKLAPTEVRVPSIREFQAHTGPGRAALAG